MGLSRKYVRPETAWLLKDKGFNDYCEWGYTIHNESMYLKRSEIGDTNKSLYSNFCTAPLQEQVIKWLLKKFICVYVCPVFEFNENREDYLHFRGFSVYASYYPDNKLASSLDINIDIYPSYEEALESGIVDILKSDVF